MECFGVRIGYQMLCFGMMRSDLGIIGDVMIGMVIGGSWCLVRRLGGRFYSEIFDVVCFGTRTGHQKLRLEFLEDDLTILGGVMIGMVIEDSWCLGKRLSRGFYSEIFYVACFGTRTGLQRLRLEFLEDVLWIVGSMMIGIVAAVSWCLGRGLGKRFYSELLSRTGFGARTGYQTLYFGIVGVDLTILGGVMIGVVIGSSWCLGKRLSKRFYSEIFDVACFGTRTQHQRLHFGIMKDYLLIVHDLMIRMIMAVS